MNIQPNTILNIALGIERKGIEFYERIRERGDADFADFLIEQEKNHIRTFEDIFTSHKEKFGEHLDMPHLDEDYLVAAYVNTEVFGPSDPNAIDPSRLLDVAIGMEKNSILFYGELYDGMVKGYEETARLIRDIQHQERQHLRLLAEKKAARTG